MTKRVIRYDILFTSPLHGGQCTVVRFHVIRDDEYMTRVESLPWTNVKGSPRLISLPKSLRVNTQFLGSLCIKNPSSLIGVLGAVTFQFFFKNSTIVSRVVHVRLPSRLIM